MRESSHSASQARDVLYMSVHSASSLQPQDISWRNLYLQALFETDKTKISMRISEAERALLFREHELFTGVHNPAERDAVNAALHSLHALRICLLSPKTFAA